MNAPAAVTDAAIEYLPLKSIAPSDTHIQHRRRRRILADQQGLADLAASMRPPIGVLEPIIVRKLAALRGLAKFELVSGERRWLAAEKAGLDFIPAIAKDLNDEQVLEIQLIENLQRKGLDPLEEAEGYRELMNLRKIKAEEVAVLIGMSRSWVYARIKLLDLDQEGQDAMARGELDASRALLVARIADPKKQASALQLALEKNWRGEGPMHSFRSLKEQLEKKRATIHLRTATFDPADGTLYKMVRISKGVEEPESLPACSNCPQRSGNCSDGAADDDPDVCTDVPCFEAKTQAATARRRAQATTQGIPIITGDEARKIIPGKGKLCGYVDLDEVCQDDEYPEPEPAPTGDEAADEQLFDAWHLRYAKYQQRTFRAILDGDWPEPTLVEDPKTRQIRELIPVKVAKAALKKKGIDLSLYRYQQHAAPSPANNRFGTEEYKAQQAKQEERQNAEIAFRQRLLAECFPKVPTGPLKREEIVAIVEDSLGRRNDAGLKSFYAGKIPQPGQMKDPDLLRLLRVLPAADNARGYWGNPTELLALAKLCKVDPAKVKKAITDEAKGKATPSKAAPTAKTKPAAKKAKK